MPHMVSVHISESDYHHMPLPGIRDWAYMQYLFSLATAQMSQVSKKSVQEIHLIKNTLQKSHTNKAF
jgi:hypothetical protein